MCDLKQFDKKINDKDYTAATIRAVMTEELPKISIKIQTTVIVHSPAWSAGIQLDFSCSCLSLFLSSLPSSVSPLLDPPQQELVMIDELLSAEAWWWWSKGWLTINFHPSQVIQRSAVDKYSSATLRNYRQLNINCEKMCVHLKSWLANVKLGTQLISRWPKYVLTTSYFKERRFQRRNCLNNPSLLLVNTQSPSHQDSLSREPAVILSIAKELSF